MATIHVVGLGPGDITGVPTGALSLMQSGLPLFLRTSRHPAAEGLESKGIIFQTFDDVYEKKATFAEVYQEISQSLIQKAKEHGEIVYAVPGHPLVAEQSVQNLLASKEDQVSVKIGPGQSFLDPVCQAVSIDPIEGFLLLDGTALSESELQPEKHTLIAQVYDRDIASSVKLTLMSVYPDEYEVTVLRAAGVLNMERLERIPLYELDRLSWIDHLTTLYVPKTTDEWVLWRDPWYLAGLIARLRGKDGCPWDKEQTHASLRPYVLEEAYEVAHAIDENDPDELVLELGDLLLQVLLHAEIASETGDFTFRDVVAALAKKMVHRHPHVFGSQKAASKAEAESSWQKAKASEKPVAGSDSLLNGVKIGQPALGRALCVQKEVAKVGFDWPSAKQVLDKVKEEMNELEAEFQAGSHRGMIEEFGDLLFAAVNFARWMNIDAESALAKATQKFEQRFSYVEKQVHKSGLSWESHSLKELDSMWNEAKMIRNREN